MAQQVVGNPVRTAQIPQRKDSVEEFLEEAEGVADFAYQTGLTTDASLVSAIAVAKKLPANQQTFDDPKLIELYSKIAAIRSKIPSATVAAIRSGWRPNQDKTRETLTNVVFIVLAIFVTLAVGQLTLVHARGTALIVDLLRLEEANPGLQFGILERRLLRAQKAVFSNAGIVPNDPPATPPSDPNIQPPPNASPGEAPPVGGLETDLVGEMGLAQDSVLRDAYDLSVLNQRLLSARTRTNQLVLEAYNPYPRLAALYSGALYAIDSIRAVAARGWCSLFSSPVDVCSIPVAPLAQDYQVKYAANYASLGETSLPVFCGYIEKIRNISNGSAGPTPDEVDDYLAKIKHVFGNRFGYDNVELVIQNCSIGLSYLWNTIPDVRSMIEQVKAITTLYAFIILPSLYGALGSFMYFLRRSLDPYSPNLSILRMSYRIAIGGLAGLAVAYFWSGADMTSASFNSAGFGLFVVAFVFGFSIEVFFSFLDRLVELSTESVRSIGSPPPPPPPPPGAASGAAGGGPPPPPPPPPNPAGAAGALPL